GLVAGDRPAPEPDVHVALAVGGGPFGGQRGGVGGGRDRVERHVDDRGDAPGRRGQRGGGEALPGGPARLVDVHVAVHQAGQQHLVVGQVHDLGHARRRPRRGSGPARPASATPAST